MRTLTRIGDEGCWCFWWVAAPAEDDDSGIIGSTPVAPRCKWGGNGATAANGKLPASTSSVGGEAEAEYWGCG